jgi:hypothetical protein
MSSLTCLNEVRVCRYTILLDIIVRSCGRSALQHLVVLRSGQACLLDAILNLGNAVHVCQLL